MWKEPAPMSDQEDPSSIVSLCENVKQLLPEELGPSAWYVLVVCHVHLPTAAMAADRRRLLS